MTADVPAGAIDETLREIAERHKKDSLNYPDLLAPSGPAHHSWASVIHRDRGELLAALRRLAPAQVSEEMVERAYEAWLSDDPSECIDLVAKIKHGLRAALESALVPARQDGGEG